MSRRTELLDSAERLVRSRGYDAFSYADLAEEVGIRKASIHHHFAKKADLGLCLIQRYRTRFVEALAAIDARTSTGGERLLAYIESYRSALDGGDMLCLCVAFTTGRESLTNPMLTELNGFHQDSREWLRKAFVLGKSDRSIDGVNDPKAESCAGLALVEGAQLIARAARDVKLFDDATALLSARANSGLG